MKKEETIHLYRILAAIKDSFLENGIADDSNFTKHNALKIDPEQVHKPKQLHEQAVKILAEELALSIRK